MSAMMHKFDKFIVDPTVIDHDNMMIEINKKNYENQHCLFYYISIIDVFDLLVNYFRFSRLKKFKVSITK